MVKREILGLLVMRRPWTNQAPLVKLINWTDAVAPGYVDLTTLYGTAQQMQESQVLTRSPFKFNCWFTIQLLNCCA